MSDADNQNRIPIIGEVTVPSIFRWQPLGAVAERGELPNEASYQYGSAFEYVLGAAAVLQDRDLKILCFPDGVTNGQVAVIVFKFLRANPEQLHKSGHLLVVAALSPVWGCLQNSTECSSQGKTPPASVPQPKPKSKSKATESSPF